MNDLKKHLDALSEAATPGRWEATFDEAYNIRDNAGLPLAQMRFLKVCGRRDTSEVAYSANLIATMVNAYRSGDLIVKGEETYTKDQLKQAVSDDNGETAKIDRQAVDSGSKFLELIAQDFQMDAEYEIAKAVREIRLLLIQVKAKEETQADLIANLEAAQPAPVTVQQAANVILDQGYDLVAVDAGMFETRMDGAKSTDMFEAALRALSQDGEGK